jgi:hypothetical protein
LGDEFPNLQVKTTIGDIDLYEWIGNRSVSAGISLYSEGNFLVGAFFSPIRLISLRYAQLN